MKNPLVIGFIRLSTRLIKSDLFFTFLTKRNLLMADSHKMFGTEKDGKMYLVIMFPTTRFLG